MADKMCVVKNRSASMVVYKIPEKNIHREFAPGEIKTIPYEELGMLSFQKGGRELMNGFLQIQSQEVRNDLNMKTELEYDMSEKDIIKLIEVDSLDAFLDALDFAPVGVIDLIKTLAIQLPMNDMEKRMALKKKTGFDVTAAIANIQKEKEEDNIAPVENTVRRVQSEATTPGRRTTPNYKVVGETEE